MSNEANVPKVLIVEDDRELADLYAEYLDPNYDVRTAYNGTQALSKLEWRPDVMLLDRRMPGMSGDEVLGEMQERGVDPMVAMVTAVDPDVDIIDSRIDEYLIKPNDQDDLIGAVEKLLGLQDISELKRELSAKKVKRNVLRVEKSAEELADIQAFGRLEERIAELESQIATIEAAHAPGSETEEPA